MLLNFACKVAYGLTCVYACGYVPILLLSFCHYRLRVLVMACLMLLASSILTLYSDTQQSRGYPLRVRGRVNLSATHTHTHISVHYIHTHYLIYSSHYYLHIMYITMYSLCTHVTHYVHYMYTMHIIYTLFTHYLHYVYVYSLLLVLLLVGLANLRWMSFSYFLYLMLFSGLEQTLTFLLYQRFQYTRWPTIYVSLSFVCILWLALSEWVKVRDCSDTMMTQRSNLIHTVCLYLHYVHTINKEIGFICVATQQWHYIHDNRYWLYYYGEMFVL